MCPSNGGGVFQNSGDGEVRRNLCALKFTIHGFGRQENFSKYFYGLKIQHGIFGGLILVQGILRGRGVFMTPFAPPPGGNWLYTNINLFFFF